MSYGITMDRAPCGIALPFLRFTGSLPTKFRHVKVGWVE